MEWRGQRKRRVDGLEVRCDGSNSAEPARDLNAALHTCPVRGRPRALRMSQNSVALAATAYAPQDVPGFGALHLKPPLPTYFRPSLSALFPGCCVPEECTRARLLALLYWYLRRTIPRSQIRGVWKCSKAGGLWRGRGISATKPACTQGLGSACRTRPQPHEKISTCLDTLCKHEQLV